MSALLLTAAIATFVPKSGLSVDHQIATFAIGKAAPQSRLSVVAHTRSYLWSYRSRLPTLIHQLQLDRARGGDYRNDWLVGTCGSHGTFLSG
jgi:hypothetical protein